VPPNTGITAAAFRRPRMTPLATAGRPCSDRVASTKLSTVFPLPCSASTSGIRGSSGSPSGTKSRYVRARPSLISVCNVTRATEVQKTISSKTRRTPWSQQGRHHNDGVPTCREPPQHITLSIAAMFHRAEPSSPRARHHRAHSAHRAATTHLSTSMSTPVDAATERTRLRRAPSNGSPKCRRTCARSYVRSPRNGFGSISRH
jgi:hypothetical protein